MQTPATEIDQRIVQLNEFIFPSLPTWRLSRRIRQDPAARGFNDAQLSRFLDMAGIFET
jgi:hypothetical protein